MKSYVRFVLVVVAMFMLAVSASSVTNSCVSTGISSSETNDNNETPPNNSVMNIPTHNFIETITAAPFYTETPNPTSSHAGDDVTAEPTITVEPTQIPEITPSNSNGLSTDDPVGMEDRIVYLTFDDGPSELTPRLLDILDEYGIKATFFTVGYFVNRHPDIVKDAVERGHLVVCHTYTHNYEKIYASADAFMEEVHQWEEAYIKAVGESQNVRYLRFPGGSFASMLSEEVRDQIISRLNNIGYSYFDWTFTNSDKWLEGNVEGLPIDEYLMKSYEETLDIAIRKDKPLIFLAHDTCEETIELIPKIIDDLIARGYSFATLADFEN